MEGYTWINKDDILYILSIGEESDRFDGEGMLQEVKLTRFDKDDIFPSEDVYDTTYGRHHAMEQLCSEHIGWWENNDEEDFKKFKIWLITSLTPITEQRMFKIERIKNKIYKDNDKIKSSDGKLHMDMQGWD